ARKHIEHIIADVRPDAGFGECTLYHEIITMQVCKQKKIPYFFPTLCRFPLNRISFYWYDTLLPFGGSGENIDHNACSSMAERIGSRNLIPIYLKNQLYAPPGFFDKALDKIRIIKGRIGGEKFNTPSVVTKLSLLKKVARQRSK